MKSPVAAVLVLSALLGAPAVAQHKQADPAGHPTSASTPPAAGSADAADRAEGVVRRIDRDAGKLTLRHGEIRNLDMPGMTMVFQVTEPSLLDKVKVGDKVTFRAEKRADAFVVTAIEVVK